MFTEINTKLKSPRYKKQTAVLFLAGAASTQVLGQAVSLSEAISGGAAQGQFRLRYESVEQENAQKNASALTLRSRIAYQTQDFNHWSAKIEVEDSRVVLGQDEYNNTVGKNTDYSVIADPEVTELEQAYIAYKKDALNFKLGRQVLVFDNHRFVGHVGWRQDRQSFDAANISYKLDSGIAINYAYIYQRNRIFAEQKDIKSKDHLLNLSYQTKLGKVTLYRYLLEQDTATSNELDTWGLRFAGSHKLDSVKLMYQLEAATQDNENGGANFSSEYVFASLGVAKSIYSASLNYESLGSDDTQIGFATPLATLHKFNGWSDQFLLTPKQGLNDLSIHLSAKLGAGKLALQWHDFSAAKAGAGVDDLGSEIDLVYSRKFAKHYSAGVKFSRYSAGDSAANKVDTDKAWLWLAYNF